VFVCAELLMAEQQQVVPVEEGAELFGVVVWQWPADVEVPDLDTDAELSGAQVGHFCRPLG
jgi:hypothetical protein